MSASLTRHLEKLCVEIGARPIGSPANDRVVIYNIRAPPLRRGRAGRSKNRP